jgi:hypothetical protein
MRHSLYFQYLNSTPSNRALGAEQKCKWWDSMSNRVTKMATEVEKEHSWQDDSLRRLEQYKAADTSSTILVSGYQFWSFRAIGYQK